MLWAVLAVVVSAPPPSKVASTYDEAACAEAQADRGAHQDLRSDDLADADDGINCSEPPPVVPAVLDCNDARVSLWLGEMIGSCDMPRPQPPGAAVRPAGGNSGEPRLCRDGRCGVDSAPVRSAARLFDELTPALGSSGPISLFLTATPLPAEAAHRLGRLDGKRLERPPRAS